MNLIYTKNLNFKQKQKKKKMKKQLACANFKTILVKK